MTENDIAPPLLAGKVCVITGATSGIGKAAAIELARLGATLVLVARDRGKGEAVLAELASDSPASDGEHSAAEHSSTEHRLELADLASLDQVRDVAGRLGELPRIDVLINNAGLIIDRRLTTQDGIEHTFAVNHLAPFLLTNLLLGKLTGAGTPARVVTVSSLGHKSGKIDLETIAQPGGRSPLLAYADSKLANVLFTLELARRLAESGAGNVTANCLHPGTVRTGFGHTGGAMLKFGVQLIAPFIRSPEQGARTVVYLASATEVESQTGGYYVNCKRRTPSSAARDAELARRLWELSAKLTGLDA